ncbi:MAG: hypothetical protein RSE13_20105 [Planktothrix sp. GU0601_MAG3]|nr:MAG: hypothetical protein RSE13_20105 [Planktothrix sp. GU0601_MAG3]
MITKTPDIVQSQLLKVLSQLSLPKQEEVLKYALLLHKKQQFQDWDSISDQEAADIKAEFYDQDLAYSEGILSDYLYQLQQEDVI